MEETDVLKIIDDDDVEIGSNRAGCLKCFKDFDIGYMGGSAVESLMKSEKHIRFTAQVHSDKLVSEYFNILL